jgi:hypothetical protein
MPLQQSPYILYSDGEGNIYEDTSLYVVGRAGWDAMPIDPADWIELPEGGNLYELPGRRGIGLDVETGEMRLCDKGWAVAAFIPPAHTGLYIAAYETEAEATAALIETAKAVLAQHLPTVCQELSNENGDTCWIPIDFSTKYEVVKV